MPLDTQGVDVNGVKRQYLVDTGGHLATAPGFDGANLHSLSTDVNGRLIPLVPNSVATATAVGALLAAPSSGANYIFGWWAAVQVTGAVEVALEAGGVIIDSVVFPLVSGVYENYASPPLGGYRTTAALTIVVATGGPLTSVIRFGVRYAPGP
jgi:hypothetical protein